MNKEKEKRVEVDVDGKKVKILVKQPGNKVLSAAQRVAAKAWTDCVRDGIMTKKELVKFMKEQGIWNEDKDKEEKDKIKQINDLERSLYIQGGKSKRLKLSEAKEIAVQMRLARAELRDLISERIALEQNTAESLSDNARFDYIVSQCTFDNNSKKVYNNLDDYLNRSDDEVAFAAASALAQLMYSIDKNVEANLPENRFLSKFNFVNDDLSLVDLEGNRVDVKGKRIDDSGYYLNDQDERVDTDGNLIDKDGNYIPSITYTDDNGKVVKPTTAKKSNGQDKDSV
jgi:hypothetical protein